MSKAGDFVGRLFGARSIAHKAHLTTTVYSRHVALGDFYSGIIDLADSFAEAYAGRYGIISDIDISLLDVDTGNIVEILRNDVAWIESNRRMIAQDYSPLQNIIDEVLAHYLSTIYKLENLL